MDIKGFIPFSYSFSYFDIVSEFSCLNYCISGFCSLFT